MGMGRREKQRRQEQLWIAHTELPRTVAHPFYEQLNRVLEGRGFDEFVEQQCSHFYAEKMGRPSLAPGRYFRLLLIGYFEGSSTVPREPQPNGLETIALQELSVAPAKSRVPPH